MDSGHTIRRLFRAAASCLFVLAMGAPCVSQQPVADPLQLQRSAVAKLDRWLESVRTTGDAASARNLLTSAQSELQTSNVVFVQRRDFGNAAWGTIKLGDAQRYMNQWPQAIIAFQYAARLAEQAHRTDFQTKALTWLAFSEIQSGSVDSAEDHARQAVRLGENCGNKDFNFDALDVAGQVETKRGDLAAANDYLNRALAMSDQVNDKYQLYYAYNDRADVYYQDALQCNYKQGYDVCYQFLQLSQDDYKKARAIVQARGYTFLDEMEGNNLQALDGRQAMIQRAQSDNQKLAAAQMFNPKLPKDVLASQYFASDSADPTNLAIAESAVKEMRTWQMGMQQRGLDLPDLNAADLYSQGSLAQLSGDLNTALAKYLRVVQLVEQDRRKLRGEQARSAFMEDKLDYYYSPAMLLLQQKLYAEAFALFEQSRSRAMADMIASASLNLSNPQERELFSELQSQRTAVAALQEKLFNLTGAADRDQNDQKIAALQTQISSLQQKYHVLETRIASEAPKLDELTSSKPVTLDSVQRAAADGRYDLLYYNVLETGVILWHISGTDVEVRNVLLPHPVLAIKTAALHDSLVAPGHTAGAPFDEDVSRQLYLYLIQPMAAYIKSNHLIIIPQEEMTAIPFQALQNPQDGKYLGERFSISYAPSATVLATLERRPNLKTGRLLAVADPKIHDAGDEVRAIGALYPGRAKVSAQLPVAKADVKAWIGNYDLIHLSVHGKFNSSDPLLSYLQFNPAGTDDGRLTAAEMFGLPLKKNSLVVLSACETGRVQATHSGELVGMVRSLLYAGAGNLVLSDWEVNAASTKLWMETFYREAQTRDPAEAARLALLAVKSRPEFGHPFFWAPFVMTGK
ncbi:MAG: CHAT domain-containing protein [Terracidiphilus sp.]